jgi:uncharacterized protein (DUF362 family)/NAD-dependent dihydropyrimidine dehydrogenase PreA subunit
MARVLIEDATYENVGGVIPKVLERFSIDWNGKRVLVKPNMLGHFNFNENSGSTTHPAVVHAVVKALRNKGAHVIVGDNPALSGLQENQRCARRSGILEASDGAYKNISDETVEVEMKARLLDHVLISKDVLEVDYMVSLPRFKTHIFTTISGAVKNSFGIVLGGEKPKVHLKAPNNMAFSEALVDIFQIRPPELTIMDGIIGMEGNGPSTSGTLRPIGKILASDNAVSLDAVVCHMMGIKPERVNYMKTALERNLGEMDPYQMDLIGKLEVLPRFKMPIGFIANSRFGMVINRWLTGIWVQNKVKVNNEVCKKCYNCVKVCPPKAMQVRQKKASPAVDQDICILCYCCVEICPENALEVKGFSSFLDRWRGQDKAPAIVPPGSGDSDPTRPSA